MRSRRIAKQKRKAKKHPGAHRAAGCWPPGSLYSSCLKEASASWSAFAKDTRRGNSAALDRKTAAESRLGPGSGQNAAILAAHPELCPLVPTRSGERRCDHRGKGDPIIAHGWDVGNFSRAWETTPDHKRQASGDASPADGPGRLRSSETSSSLPRRGFRTVEGPARPARHAPAGEPCDGGWASTRPWPSRS